MGISFEKWDKSVNIKIVQIIFKIFLMDLTMLSYRRGNCSSF